MVRSASRSASRSTAPGTLGHRSVRVSLLIPTHALPPLSYRLPRRLLPEVAPGTVVVAPLSGRSRVGVVVGEERDPERAREEILSVVPELSLPASLLETCVALCESSAVPLASVLRTALPPGLDAGRYRVTRPNDDWPWGEGTCVPRSALKRTLGPEGLRAAEAEGRVSLVPSTPERATTEWAVVRAAADPDLGRAPRQRDVLELLRTHGGELETSALLSEAEANRSILRGLVSRGAVRLVRRPASAPILAAPGEEWSLDRDLLRDAALAAAGRGNSVWRMPAREEPGAVAALARAVVEHGGQMLVLAPGIGAVDALVRLLRRVLPAGRTVAPYHSGLGKDRAVVYEAAAAGEVDVLVGTRAAALVPLSHPGSLCLVDEPDGSYRGESGYGDLPVHARDVVLARGRAEKIPVVFLSPVPSLRLRGPAERGGSRPVDLPVRLPASWPSVRIVDMRGSGAPLSSHLIAMCRRVAARGGRAGVVVDRLGYATAVACNGCGAVRRCPNCDLPLALLDRAGPPVCSRCGPAEAGADRCDACGSDRLSATGMAVERVREDLAAALDEPVGLLTAGRRELEGASVVVGTARSVLHEEWEAVILPDVDASLNGSGAGAVERSFRMIHGAAEAARDLLLLQTRLPEHYALRAAVRGDYEALAAAELPRLRAAGYPPFAHVAAVTFTGQKKAILDAVESRLRPALAPEVEMSGVVRIPRPGQPPEWRVLLRSGGREAVARAAAGAARLAAGDRRLAVRVEVDPEEV